VDSAILHKLKISSWELDINSLTMHFSTPSSSESLNFLDWQEQIRPRDRDLVINQILDTINEKRGSFDCQFHFQTKDSSWACYRMRGLPVSLRAGAKFTRLQGVIEDITAYEEQVNSLQKRISYLEAEAKEKNNFFASITHELRTPIGGVIGLAELLLEESQLSAENSDLIDSIRKCGRSLLTIVNDTLDFSKLEARKLEVVPVPFQLSKTIADIELLLSAKISKKDLIFVAEIAKNVPDAIVADVNRFQQILMNIIGNALKFTPTGGGICLRIELLESAESRITLLCSVADSGVGIKSEKQQTIFDQYAQEDNNTATKYGGTGLGLSIARELIGLFGGSLKVRSEPGRGTVFQFTLQVEYPGKDIEQPLVLEKQIEAREFRSLKIMLVEDNLVNQKVAMRMLEKAGHTVILANNGEEAVSLFQKVSFDLILMDIQMPIMSGDQATQLIREQEKANGASPVPIVALTAHAMSGDREKYLALGMNDYLTKPIERQLLMDAVASLHLK